MTPILAFILGIFMGMAGLLILAAGLASRSKEKEQEKKLVQEHIMLEMWKEYCKTLEKNKELEE